MKAMHGCAQVYHLAAYARTGSGNPEPYFTTNVGGTINVMDCATDLNIQKVIYTSTAGLFDRGDGNSIGYSAPQIIYLLLRTMPVNLLFTMIMNVQSLLLK